MKIRNILLIILLSLLLIFLILWNYQQFREDSIYYSIFNKNLSLDLNEDEQNIEFQQNYPEEQDFLNELPSNKNIKMLFFGDLMLDRYVLDRINRHGLDYLLEKINQDNFSSSFDIVSANLEGAVTNKGAHYKPDNAYDFAFSPELINSLKKYNFNFFNLANNHLSDQGQRGIDETYQNLSSLGFYYSGCRDAFLSSSSDFMSLDFSEEMPILSNENCSNIILNINNKKVAFLGISLVYKDIDSEKIEKRIKELKQQSDLIIVNIHFGLEYQAKANSKQEIIARKMIDAGADLIIGHHPHVIQNYEVYKDKWIFYSLGNFVFDQYFSAETQEGLAISIEFIFDENNNSKIDYQIYKIKSKGSRIEEILKMP